MATLRDIRRRISSIQSTQQITKAMRMVAAAKLRRAQERMIAARPYAQRMGYMVNDVVASLEDPRHPFLTPRENRCECVVVVSSDRGLCGSYNHNTIRSATDYVESSEAERVLMYPVGKKVHDFLMRRGYDMLGHRIGILDKLEFSGAVSIGDALVEAFVSGHVDRVQIIYNEFKSIGQQVLTTRQLLPFVPEEVDVDRRRLEYIFEPSSDSLLEVLCPKNLHIQVWRALLESYASEQGARMTAMEAATDNAQELIQELTLYYNKVRQASITKEIAEIVGGAEALME